MAWSRAQSRSGADTTRVFRPGVIVGALCITSACAGPNETVARRQFETHPLAQDSAPRTSEQVAPVFDGSLRQYTTHALQNNAELRAAYARWRAQVERIVVARRLPEPVVSFGVFVRSVETRVGPQLARVGVQQSFPWPSQLSAGADAASAVARAEQRRFEALALSVARQVSEAYWRLWLVRVSQEVHRHHRELLSGLSETVRARFVTGSATLADQQQVDLSVVRVDDLLHSMASDERRIEARLRAALSVAPQTRLPASETPPEPVLPRASIEELRALAMDHPMIDASMQMAQSQSAMAEREEAAAYPALSLAADWIITGDADNPDMPESGKDAVVVGGSIKLPLWQGSYDAAAAAARAEALAQRAQAQSKRDWAVATLDEMFVMVQNEARRVQLFEHTLVPQAEAAFESVLGAYAVGRGSVAAALLSQTELLDLRLERAKAQAEFAIAWAQLEELVGQSVPSQRAGAKSVPSEGP